MIIAHRLISHLLQNKIQVSLYDEKSFKYDIALKRPVEGACCPEKRISKNGNTTFRMVLDVNIPGTDISRLYISTSRFRCSHCGKPVRSNDEDAIEWCLAKGATWTYDALVFLIRKLLAEPECTYEDLEERYGASIGSVRESFKTFLDSIREDITPLLKCEQIIIWPIKDRNGSDVCIFGAQGNKIGLLEIGTQNSIKPFLEWVIDKPFPKQVICNAELANAINLASIYPNYAIPKMDLTEFGQSIAKNIGEDLWAQLQTIDVHAEDCDERVDRLCNQIFAKRAIKKMALGDDIREYINALRLQVEYDEEYITEMINTIIDLRARRYDDADIVLRSCFTSSLHRDILLKTEYARYVIEENESPA